MSVRIEFKTQTHPLKVEVLYVFQEYFVFSIIKFSSRIFSYSRCAGILINAHLAHSMIAIDG